MDCKTQYCSDINFKLIDLWGQCNPSIIIPSQAFNETDKLGF